MRKVVQEGADPARPASLRSFALGDVCRELGQDLASPFAGLPPKLDPPKSGKSGYRVRGSPASARSACFIVPLPAWKHRGRLLVQVRLQWQLLGPECSILVAAL